MQGSSKRQKMINLMYIVLIALMGLGVHRESREQESNEALESGQQELHPNEPIEQPTGGALAEHSELRAVSIPEQPVILLGDTYKAYIGLVGTDTTGLKIYVEGQSAPLSGTSYSSRPSRVGLHQYKGYVERPDTEGRLQRYPFVGQYQVLASRPVISTLLSRVLYAGIDNALDISVAGLDPKSFRIELSHGSIRYHEGQWIVRPQGGASELQLSIYQQTAGAGSRLLGQERLRVRPLPPPSPYIALGEGRRFRGGSIARASLLSAGGVGAAIDDGILNLEYRVESFQTVAFDGLGNAIPEASVGGRFSERQVRQIQGYARGKRLYVSEIKARGADGVLHSLPALELIIN